jgi:uncharacterized protein (TIGR00288 family)
MGNQLAVFIDFENIALWAEQEFLDFELTSLVEYLQARGNVALIRAYGDWSRFSRYREDLMHNTVDLIQIFSVRAGKNRADIRMALDALETAIQRPQIDTFVIVSGDSDFGPLVVKLREYGKSTLGIGPREVTHPLLVRACDEFVYIEAALGELVEDAHLTDSIAGDSEAGRQLLLKALRQHSQRNELPVLAAKLKQTMLGLDGSFNEANYGFTQFKKLAGAEQRSADALCERIPALCGACRLCADGRLGAAPVGRAAGEQRRHSQQLPPRCR